MLFRSGVAPFVPIETVCPTTHSLSMPSNESASLVVSPLMNVSSNCCYTARAFSATTAASRSCTLLRVRAR